jgi:hypothetical protein
VLDRGGGRPEGGLERRLGLGRIVSLGRIVRGKAAFTGTVAARTPGCPHCLLDGEYLTFRTAWPLPGPRWARCPWHM